MLIPPWVRITENINQTTKSTNVKGQRSSILSSTLIGNNLRGGYGEYWIFYSSQGYSIKPLPFQGDSSIISWDIQALTKKKKIGLKIDRDIYKHII